MNRFLLTLIASSPHRLIASSPHRLIAAYRFNADVPQLRIEAVRAMLEQADLISVVRKEP